MSAPSEAPVADALVALANGLNRDPFAVLGPHPDERSRGILVRAFAYVFGHGHDGLKAVGECAVLNANYLAARVTQAYPLAYQQPPMHEFVATATRFKKHGVRAMDIAKRMIDLGFHPSTVYFPLIVDEAMMVEPTETESKETLDAFAEALLQVAQEAEDDPDLLHEAPVTTPVRRLDEAKAARELRLRWGSDADRAAEAEPDS